MTEQELMLISILNCRRVDLYTQKKTLSDNQKKDFQKMQERRKKGEPLQYIVGSCEFMGLTLFVDERVLIPRPETELLAELVADRINKIQSGKTLSILDLGTGSGNIAISLAKSVNDCCVTAVDISEKAICLAQDNARFNGVNEKIDFVCQDMRDVFQTGVLKDKKFDVIVSNPPYIPTSEIENLPEDVRQEPRLALDGGKDGLDYYRQIIRDAKETLKDGGLLVFEIGDNQRFGVEEIFSYSPLFSHIEFKKDYAGTDRIVVAQLISNKGEKTWKN